MSIERRPFTDLLSHIVDNRGRTCPTSSSGIPLIATNCIRNESLHPRRENVRFVGQEIYDGWFRAHPEPGDIIFVTKGTPGRVCMVPNPVDFCIAQDMVAVRADQAKVDPRYLFAVLRAPETQDAIARMHVGSLIPHFKKGDFHQLQLPVPARDVQVAIGDIYIALSEKIELNRSISETLEETARSLFKSWFVDFDPVRAKAEGRKPIAMDAATAALFPDVLETSSNGPREVPRGWSVQSLDHIANFLNGLALQKFPPIAGRPTLPIIKIAQLRAKAPNLKELADAAIPRDYIIEDGDLLFSWSGSLLVELWCSGRGALNQHLFKVTSDRFPQWFVKGWLDYHLPAFRRIAATKATTMGHIQRHHLSDAKVVVPDQRIVDRATSLFAPIFSRVVETQIESRTLCELRDYLLTKLLSGEVRVRDVHKLVGGAR